MFPTSWCLVTLFVLSSARSPFKIYDEVFRADDPAYRLPKGLRPTNYEVNLTTFLEDGDFQFNGAVAINVINDVPETEISTITLNVANLDIQKVEVDGTAQINYRIDDTHQFLVIENSEKLSNEFLLKIEFNGTLDDTMLGFYRSYYMKEGKKVWLATTQFQATHARKAFPCFDEPHLKAEFTFRFKIPTLPGYHVLFNTPMVEQEEGWITFEKTPKMSTYLLAFVISDFVNRTEDIVSVWSRKSAQADTVYSSQVGSKLVSAMGDYVAYPYTDQMKKMDKVAVPDFSAGAMENWGLVTYRERLVLYGEGTTDSLSLQNIATVHSHEIAHMWFGDLVSPEWWNCLWLNEGFATYFEYFTTAEVHKQWKLAEQFVVRELHLALESDWYSQTRPMTADVHSHDAVRVIFDAISYSKAGSVIRMFRHFLGEGTFRSALQAYVKAQSFGVSTPEVLFGELQKQALTDHPDDPVLNSSVIQILDSWNSQFGYPVVTVTRDYVSNVTTITQQRFQIANTTDDLMRYYIPITYTTQSEANFTHTFTRMWLPNDTTEANITIEIQPEEWIIMNIQQTGYYRVNYDEDNWHLLIKQLHVDPTIIHEVNRAQLLDDALDLARAGFLDYSIALDLTSYLRNESQYVPWLSAAEGLSFLNLRLQGDDLHDIFKAYIRSIIQSIAEELTFEEGADDGHVQKLFRNLIMSWSCKMDDKTCLDNASNAFEAYKQNSSNVVTPDLKSIVYCYGLKNSENQTDAWSFLWSVYNVTNYPSDQTIILGALGCTADEALLQRYLENTITEDSGIRRQDGLAAFSSVLSTPAGIDIALSFLEQNFEGINQTYSGFSPLGSVISTLASRFTTEDQVNRLKKFVDDNRAALGSAAMAADAAMEDAGANIEWTKTHKPALGRWLKDRMGDAAPGLHASLWGTLLAAAALMVLNKC